MPLPVVTAYFDCPIIRCYIIGSTAILPRPASLPACAASEIAHKSSRFPFLFDYSISLPDRLGDQLVHAGTDSK